MYLLYIIIIVIIICQKPIALHLFDYVLDKQNPKALHSLIVFHNKYYVTYSSIQTVIVYITSNNDSFDSLFAVHSTNKIISSSRIS